jgi:ribose 5-phosphate isomerase
VIVLKHSTAKAIERINNMRMQEALRFVRSNGFTTKKQNGVWWINKPYHTADMIESFNGVIRVGLWQKHIAQRVFIDFEEFKEGLQ